MSWWSFIWPLFAGGVVIGLVGSTLSLRRKQPRLVLVALALALAGAVAWHGPFGAAKRFTGELERSARTTLDAYEMPQVRAHVHHSPLTRALVLSGPADDFQRGELVRILEQLPGVSSVSWSEGRGGLPLILEVLVLALLGFIVGFSLAYLVELRRRYNAQWKW